MSAPAHESPSISSSGYADGLGRRDIAFDRETGTLLERLYVRPEIGVFERDIASRIDRLQALEDERFARPLLIERDGGRIVVVSEYVSGIRVSDLLEMPDTLQDAPTLDIALAFLFEALPALAMFHAITGGAHGVISCGRTVLTSSPKVVFLDGAFGDVIGRMHYSRARLWREFGLAVSASAGASRFSVGTDIAQVALTALMLVIGRPIRQDEYPNALPSLISEVSDVAMIRGSDAFATGLQEFLTTALPVASGASYESAQDALTDVRRIAELEMGTAACSRALTALIEQIGVSADPFAAGARSSLDSVALDDDTVVDLSGDTSYRDDDTLLADEHEETTEPEETLDFHSDSARFDDGHTDSSSFDTPYTSSIDEPATRVASSDFDTFAARDTASESRSYSPDGYEERSTYSSRSDFSEPPAVHNEPERSSEPTYDTPVYSDQRTSSDFAPVAFEAASPSVEDPNTAPAPEASTAAADSTQGVATWEATDTREQEQDQEQDQDQEQESAHSFFSPRRKRGEKSKSARARKDRLRSAAAAFKETVMSRVTHGDTPARAADPPREEPPAAPPPPKPAPPPLIPASRAARFETPLQELPEAPVPRPFTPPAPNVPITPAPLPVPLVPASAANSAPTFAPPTAPMPVFPGQSVTVPPVVPPPPPVAAQGSPISLAPSTPSIPLSPSTAGLKLKTPSLAQPVRRERYEPPPMEPPRFSSAQPESARQFPWKLATAAIVIVLIGVLGGRTYLAGRKVEEERKSAADAAAAAAAAKLPPMKRGSAAVASGRITIETQPAGAKVLLDGLAAGQTPLTLDGVTAGKHVITLITESGSVKRTVKVEGGQTVTLNEQIFGGWIAIFAPITFDVAEKGRPVGNTEEGRLMLSPGRHELTLTNKALGYSAVHTVDIEPGEVRSLTLEPKGTASFNAVPWAEVWVDDQKAGETPLANLQLPLGVHNVVFKNPQYGERKMSITVRANEPAALSVDFNKQ